MPSRKQTALAVLVGLTVFGSSCNCNVLIDPTRRAVVLPQSANVAVGATHDLLIIACQDKVTIGDFLLPVVSTALFVGLGRLDAAFYLPGALVKSAIPKCEPVDYLVSGAALNSTAFELEPTANPAAFKAHARTEGEAVFTAQVNAAGDRLEVSTTLKALKANRVTLALRCETPPTGLLTLPLFVPVDGSVEFSHQLFNGTTLLAGYGFYGVSSPRLTIKDGTRGSVVAKVASQRGPFTVTSDIDPAFSLSLTAYDVSDFDPLAIERVSSGHLFVGETTVVRPKSTIGGKAPCVRGFSSTVTIETPSVCGFSDRTDTFTLPNFGNTPVTLKALTTGTCRVAVSRTGSTPAFIDIPVFRGFERLAALPTQAVHPAISIADLWLASPNETFLVGTETDISGRSQNITLRRVGAAWTVRQSLTPPSLRFVHGSRADGAVFAVGADGRGASWSGTAWVQFDGGVGEDLRDVWVNSATDAYAVGDLGTFIHFDGTRWSSIDAGVSTRLRGLWGDVTGAVYVVGWNGTAFRWAGGTLTEILPPGVRGDAGFSANAINGSSSSDLWINTVRDALHFDGTRWTSNTFGTKPGDAINAVWPIGDGFAYALVRRGSIAYVDRFDGMRTVSIPVPTTARAITGIGNDVVVLTGTELLIYRHDSADVFP